MKTKRHSGFTVVELMVGIVVLAVLIVIASPSFRDMVINNRVSSQTNALVGALNVARSEAVKRGHGVSLCASGNGATCTGGADFSGGWIIFDDSNANQAIDGDDSVLFSFPALSAASTANFSSAANLTFVGSGRPVGGFSGAVATVCPPDGGSYCRYICVNAMGRPRVSQTEDALCGR